MTRSLDDLELELRKVPGVVGVGVEESAGTVRVDLVISVPSPSPLLVRAAEDAVRDLEADKVILSVSSVARLDAAATRERRVQLVSVGRWDGPAGPGTEVHLRWEDRQSVGRDLAAGPGGAAAATLDALDKLGVDVPFQLTATVPSSPASDGVTVLVKLASIAGLSGRMGLVKAVTAEEAASRAVLCALNRFISDPRNAPRTGAGVAALTAPGRHPAGVDG